MENKFREFWLLAHHNDPSSLVFIHNSPEAGGVHVIEYAALESANAEMNQLKMQLDMTNNNWPHEKKLHEQLKSTNAEIERLKYYETQWQSIAGKANLKHLVASEKSLQSENARLLPLLEKAIELANYYANSNGIFADSEDCDISDSGHEYGGKKAREFLTTLADASGEEK